VHVGQGALHRVGDEVVLEPGGLGTLSVHDALLSATFAGYTSTRMGVTL
jgi:hypothetical protein